METDAKDLDDEFNKKVIFVLDNNEKNFVSNWSEKQKELVAVDKSIQSEISEYLNKYLNLGKKNIDTFKVLFTNRVNWFSGNLLKIIGVISFLFFSALTVLGYDWGISEESPLSAKISRMVIVFVIYVVSIYASIWSLKSKFIDPKFEQTFQEKNKLAIDENVKTLSDDKCSIDSDVKKIKEVFEGFKSSLQDTSTVICNMVPTYKEINELEKFKETWYMECCKLKKVTAYFSLKELETEIVNLEKKSINEYQGSSESKIREAIISYICEKSSFDVGLMGLFVSCYYEENSDTQSNWIKIQENNKQLHRLTEILFKLEKLDLAKNSELNIEILQKILLKTQTFEFISIKTNVSLYLRICSFLRNYFIKLTEEKVPLKDQFEEKVPLKDQLNCENIINNIDFEKDFESIFVEIFSKELHKSLNIDADENVKEAYVVALMAIVLNPDINFRDAVCKKAAKNNNSICILMAYHKLREQKAAANESFLLSDIFKSDNLSEIISRQKEKIENDNAEKEIFRYMELSLSRGEWHESSQIIMQKMIEDLSKRIKNKEKYEAFKRAFTNIFKKVNINALDRAVDAGLFTVYFILTNSSYGKFIDKVVEPLAIRNYIKNGKTNTNKIEEFQKENKISLYYNLKDSHIPKYDFDKYSDSTRIGILHKDIDFSTFVKDITDDVEKLLEKETKDLTDETKWKDIGFIVLRISPSEYSFGILDKEIEKTCKVKLINLNIASCIASLASSYLKDEQKLAVSTLDNTINILDVIDQLKIYEYLSEDVQKSLTQQEGNFLQGKELKEEIKKYLESIEIYSFKELSHLLNYSSDKEKEGFKTSLYTVFANAYSNKYPKKTIKQITQKRCVNEFLDLLESLNELWM